MTLGSEAILDLPDTGSLDGLFNSRSVAFIGATERSVWTTSTLSNLDRFGFGGGVHIVNRKGEAVCGRVAATSASSIGEQVDTALLMVPAIALEDAIEDIAAADIRQAVILTSGLGETGEAGMRLQASVAARAAVHGIRLLGPNCLGFVNYSRSLPLWTVPVRKSRRPGRLAIVSQSGAMADEMQGFAHRHGIGLSFMASTGNEVDIGVDEIIEFLAENDDVGSIALFLESVRDGAAFRRAVRLARDRGKPITLLKVGASAVSSRMAQTHTGALVGDDHVFSAMCASEGLTRVSSLEDLILTSDLMARLPTLGEGGLALGALSGGLCEIAADQADRLGLALPELSGVTVSELREILPGFATPQNPLDVTGGALLQPELLEGAIGALGKDPAIAATAFVLDAPFRDDKGGFRSTAFAALSSAFARTGKPALVVSNMMGAVSDDSIAIADAHNLVYFSGGVDKGVRALNHAFRWHRRRDNRENLFLRDCGAVNARPTGEREVLDYLAANGVSVIPAVIVGTASEAALATKQMTGPFALKILAADLAHKSDVGGVMLNVAAKDIAKASEEIVERVTKAMPGLHIDGVIVSPMRSGGLELIVGLTRDPQWGLVLTLGLGGVQVEALKDFSTRLLPITSSAVLEMLAELKTTSLLDGHRGQAVADRRAIAEAVCAIASAAEAMGSDLLSLEVNPLFVAGSHVECLDGLVEWADNSGE